MPDTLFGTLPIVGKIDIPKKFTNKYPNKKQKSIEDPPFPTEEDYPEIFDNPLYDDENDRSAGDFNDDLPF
ncbi:MAG: hypothetical protein KAX05_05685 [Bacteroidales bacterium]|nr:hypothetical protein [Bacteroidales bacterium]